MEQWLPTAGMRLTPVRTVPIRVIQVRQMPGPRTAALISGRIRVPIPNPMVGSQPIKSMEKSAEVVVARLRGPDSQAVGCCYYLYFS